LRLGLGIGVMFCTGLELVAELTLVIFWTLDRVESITDLEIITTK